MRLTDDRYEQQRLRLEVALRMIRHEARTNTIRDCTGVSEDRIRKLHRTYFAVAHAPRRRRGKSPQQTHCLTRNLQTRLDAALLTGIYYSSGLIDALRPQPHTIDVPAAARICEAFEWFSRIRLRIDKSEFTFEHAFYLLRSLLAGDEIAAIPCPRCEGLMIQDRYALPRAHCPLCEIKRQAEPKRSRRKKPVAESAGELSANVSGAASTAGGNRSAIPPPVETSCGA